MEEEWVTQESPLVACAFGWGQTFRLYRNHLEVNGESYDLKELTQVNLVHIRVLGIPSARLELRFARKQLVLRGIAAITEARRAADYLKTWYEDSTRVTDYSAAFAPAPTVILSSPQSVRPPLRRSRLIASRLESSAHAVSQSSPLQSPPARRVESDISTEEDFSTLQWERERIVVASPSTRVGRRGQIHRAQGGATFDPPQKMEKIVTPSVRSKDDSCEYETPPSSTGQYADADRFERIKTNISLPVVRVPVRLLPGEHAHYSTNATLSGERSGPEQETHKHYTGYYPAQDHGMLILTNRRMIYIGRNNQIVLNYNYLLHFSRLRTAVAFQADHWQKRVIFSVPQPIECALYMETILHRLQQSVSYQEQLL